MLKITYQVFNIIGKFRPSGHIDVLSREPHANSPQVYQFASQDWLHGCVATQPLDSTGQPQGHFLYNVPWVDEIQNQLYVGELGCKFNIQTPPIPVRRTNGPDIYEGTSLIHTWDTKGYPDTAPLNSLDWSSYLLHKNQPWGPWLNTYRIGLLERNPDPHPEVAYNYIWSYNLANQSPALVNFWYGVLSGDDLTGHEFYAISVKE